MVSQRFRIETPTLAIVEVDGQKTTMYVQTGEIVTVREWTLGRLATCGRGMEWPGSDDVHY